MTDVSGRWNASGPRRAWTVVVALALMACGEAQDSGPSGGVEWPKRVTLRSPSFAKLGEPLRLSDGEIVATGGDVSLFLGVQVSLQPAVGDGLIFCDKGTQPTLDAVSVDEQTCPGDANGRWSSRLFFGSANPHLAEEGSIGASALVLNLAGDSVYRMRLVGDSVALNAEGVLGTATVMFDYDKIR